MSRSHLFKGGQLNSMVTQNCEKLIYLNLESKPRTCRRHCDLKYISMFCPQITFLQYFKNIKQGSRFALPVILLGGNNKLSTLFFCLLKINTFDKNICAANLAYSMLQNLHYGAMLVYQIIPCWRLHFRLPRV